MKPHPTRLLLPLGFLVSAVTLSAHPLHPDSTTFVAGCSHPLAGWDHLLAMVAIGVWAAQLGGRARWGVPLAFLGAMSLAAMAGAGFGVVPAIDQGAAASVLVLGLLIGTAARVPVAAGLGLAALFAIFHGYAHGAELPVGGSLVPYGAGFLFTSAALHVVGFILGQAASRGPARLLRGLGWGLAVSGLFVLAA